MLFEDPRRVPKAAAKEQEDNYSKRMLEELAEASQEKLISKEILNY